MDERRDIVDIPGVTPARPAPAHEASSRSNAPARSPRPWLGILFRCCTVYARIYRAPGADRYVGNCPRCGAEVRARVGEGGTSQRIFYAE